MENNRALLKSHILVMDKSIGLKFSIWHYLLTNSTVHLCTNFHPKIWKNVLGTNGLNVITLLNMFQAVTF